MMIEQEIVWRKQSNAMLEVQIVIVPMNEQHERELWREN